MPNVRFMSRRDVETHFPISPSHLISISDGEDDQALVIDARWTSVSRMFFLDGEYDEARIEMFGTRFKIAFQDYFSMAQADELKRLIVGLTSSGKDIVVNCEAGRSRSAAVARFIAETSNYKLLQDTPHANQTVLRLLRGDPILRAALRENTQPQREGDSQTGWFKWALTNLGLQKAHIDSDDQGTR